MRDRTSPNVTVSGKLQMDPEPLMQAMFTQLVVFLCMQAHVTFFAVDSIRLEQLPMMVWVQGHVCQEWLPHCSWNTIYSKYIPAAMYIGCDVYGSLARFALYSCIVAICQLQ